ncbi:MAG: alpha/beta hydrolase [Flavobacteriaceae bacterium]|nr:alpha/beta hydrolase [Flavobacteriaceae bacterium]
MLKKIFYLFTFFALLFCFYACGAWASFRTSDKKVIKRFAKHGLQAEVHYETCQGLNLRHIHSKPYDPALPTLFFIHGAPGSSDNFDGYLTDSLLNQHVNLISLDRLGYGYSEFGVAYPEIEEQAESLLPVLQKYHNPSLPSLLVGWSYGGPIAAAMVLKDPVSCSGVVLLALALDPEAERYFKLGRLAEYRLTRWMVPQTFIVAQKEKRAHVASLKEFEDLWNTIAVPVLMLHGAQDKIVPFAPNAEFATSHFPKALFQLKKILNAGHVFPMQQEQKVISILLKELDRIETKTSLMKKSKGK